MPGAPEPFPMGRASSHSHIRSSIQRSLTSCQLSSSLGPLDSFPSSPRRRPTNPDEPCVDLTKARSSAFPHVASVVSPALRPTSTPSSMRHVPSPATFVHPAVVHPFVSLPLKIGSKPPGCLSGERSLILRLR